MESPECKVNYPLSIVAISLLLTLLIYGTGAFLLWQFGILFALAYLLFVLILEVRLISGHCVDCFYYGKTCAFGKGRLSALFFGRGNPERFNAGQVTWKDIVPDFLVFIIPALAGVLLLVQGFSWTILVLVVALIILGFAGTAYVRSQLACRYCKQREIGCPAEKLFERPEKP